MTNIDSECCGQHEVCEKQLILDALKEEIEYYEDEELDRFRGVQSDEYMPDEIEEFREILYTMRPDEVSWATATCRCSVRCFRSSASWRVTTSSGFWATKRSSVLSRSLWRRCSSTC